MWRWVSIVATNLWAIISFPSTTQILVVDASTMSNSVSNIFVYHPHMSISLKFLLGTLNITI